MKMRLDLICVISAVLLLALCCPASAAELPTWKITPYDYNVSADSHFEFLNIENESLDFWLMLECFMSPFTDLLGDYFPLIIYLLWMVLVYFRSNSVTLLAVSTGVTIWAWASWLPEPSLLGIALVLLIGVVSVVYKLFKK